VCPLKSISVLISVVIAKDDKTTKSSDAFLQDYKAIFFFFVFLRRADKFSTPQNSENIKLGILKLYSSFYYLPELLACTDLRRKKIRDKAQVFVNEYIKAIINILVKYLFF